MIPLDRMREMTSVMTPSAASEEAANVRAFGATLVAKRVDCDESYDTRSDNRLSAVRYDGVEFVLSQRRWYLVRPDSRPS